jgi:hypothetical protein
LLSINASAYAIRFQGSLVVRGIPSPLDGLFQVLRAWSLLSVYELEAAKSSQTYLKF